MQLLADVNVNEAYVVALRNEGHAVARVSDVDTLDEAASDREILSAAASRNAVVVTNDAKDFQQFDTHAGVIVVPQTELTAGEVAAAVARIERAVPDCSNLVLYATSWT
jgi:predicted nuclease of predicted toxin-antitoxin system